MDRQGKDPEDAEDDDRLGLDEEARTHAEQSAALLKLAKKQGMNTDVRRSIFVVLMSSEDYVDACERLSHLKISDQQRPEVVRVLLHCLGNVGFAFSRLDVHDGFTELNACIGHTGKSIQPLLHAHRSTSLSFDPQHSILVAILPLGPFPGVRGVY